MKEENVWKEFFIRCRDIIIWCRDTCIDEQVKPRKLYDTLQLSMFDVKEENVWIEFFMWCRDTCIDEQATESL